MGYNASAARSRPADTCARGARALHPAPHPNPPAETTQNENDSSTERIQANPRPRSLPPRPSQDAFGKTTLSRHTLQNQLYLKPKVPAGTAFRPPTLGARGTLKVYSHAMPSNVHCQQRNREALDTRHARCRRACALGPRTPSDTLEWRNAAA
jgi:hypothetical protein